MANNIEAPFVFGVRVEGDTFTDRKEETERLKANFKTYRLGIASNNTRLTKALIEKDFVCLSAPKYLELSYSIQTL